MKSILKRIVGRISNGAFVIALAAVMSAVIFPTAAFASDGDRPLDPVTSSARLFLGSAKNPNSVNAGVARVTGTINLDETGPENSVVNLAIYPADEDWAAGALGPEGNLPSSYVPDASDHTLLTFKSTRTQRAADGAFDVTGDLTLIRVERSITADPSEAYSGPVYGSPVIYTVTEQATFTFSDPDSSSGTGSAVASQNSVLEVSGSSRIRHEDFKELSGAISGTNWPSVVAGEHCDASAVGEDYSGIKCTGTEIATRSADNCQAPPTIGEDYSGMVCALPAGDQTTIALDLRFSRPNNAATAEAISGDSAAQ
jgi:polyisoprenoid-binding protein YceI